MAFADLTALGAYAPTQSQVDKIAGWRNYAMTQLTFTNFPTGDPGFAGEADCAKQDFYGSYLLYFGDPPFTTESLFDKLLPRSIRSPPSRLMLTTHGLIRR